MEIVKHACCVLHPALPSSPSTLEISTHVLFSYNFVS
jgi:hypothetical protein